MRFALRCLAPFLALFALGIAAHAQSTIDLDWGLGVQHGVSSIDVGDTVRWTWTDAASHSVLSTGVLFPSSSVFSGVGTTYSHTFTSAGSFPYTCGVHGASMAGTIQVNQPQSVPTLRSPLLLGAAVVIAGSLLLFLRGRREAGASA
jgi:hypothetical protein